MKKRRKYKVYLLLLVCILIQVAAVFPHHHHSDFFCLHPDWKNCTSVICEHDLHHQSDGSRHTCGITCITNFQCGTPDLHWADLSPDYSFYSILYTLFDVFQPYLAHPVGSACEWTVYIEGLHTHQVVCAIGLRAPPFV